MWGWGEPFALKKKSLSIPFMRKGLSSLKLPLVRIISLHALLVPVNCEYAALKLKGDHFIFLLPETLEERFSHCHISFAGKPVFILG